MNILLIEDDLIQMELFKNLIEKKYLDVRLYTAPSIKDALSILTLKNIDLFFIDINLSDGSGIDLAKNIREIPLYMFSGIVFITSNVIHIIEAFKTTHCYDFISKPYKIEEIYNIIDMFMNSNTIDYSSKFCFLDMEDNIQVKIYHKNILFVECSLRSCIIHTKECNYTLKRTSLTKLLSLLNSDNIVQCHKSFAVNLNSISTIEKISSKLSFIHFNNHSETAPLGYNYKKYILERLD